MVYLCELLNPWKQKVEKRLPGTGVGVEGRNGGVMGKGFLSGVMKMFWD